MNRQFDQSKTFYFCKENQKGDAMRIRLNITVKVEAITLQLLGVIYFFCFFFQKKGSKE